MSVKAAISNPQQLGFLLQAEVPASWPPELLDTPALEWTVRWMENPANDRDYGMYWMVLRRAQSEAPDTHGRILVGAAGFKGPPRDGTVEVGYGVVTEYQRRGYATETVNALLSHAFASPNIERVIAETLPGLAPSIGVLEKCGFRFIGDGSEPGVIRYEIVKR